MMYDFFEQYLIIVFSPPIIVVHIVAATAAWF